MEELIPIEPRELPIEPPIGQFILDQTDIKPIMSANGAYYHYSDVCTLLNRLKAKNKIC